MTTCKQDDDFIVEKSNVPDWYTIDDLGLSSLCYFLKKEYEGETVFVTVLKSAPVEILEDN